MKPRQGAVHVVGGTDDDEDAEIPRARAEKWSLADVAEATAQFAQERVIEAEGQSVVLRGSARDGRDVAVKRCKQPQPETQALFLREVRWLWRRVIWVMGGGLAAGGGLLLSVLLRGGQAVQAAAARDPGAVSPRGMGFHASLPCVLAHCLPGCTLLSRLHPPVSAAPSCLGCTLLSRLHPPVSAAPSCLCCTLLSRLHPPVSAAPSCLGCTLLSLLHPPVSAAPSCLGCTLLSRLHPPVSAAPSCLGCTLLSRLHPPVMLITSMRHPSLLLLVGYCDEEAHAARLLDPLAYIPTLLPLPPGQVMLITSVRHPSLLPLVGNCDEEADTHFRAHAARLLNPLAYIPTLPPLPPCQVMLITSLRHPNLLPLVGYCDEGSEQILIFEHMQHGSLASWLRPRADGNVSRPPLTFEQRLRIAADVARAVEFLHSQPKPVVHRDVKTQTILLDEKFNAKLGGLGTRKHLPGESSRVRVQRRKGYLDPEYCQTFVVTTKAEIFAVGVVILELITGRPPVVEEEVVAKEGRNTVKIVTLAQWPRSPAPKGSPRAGRAARRSRGSSLGGGESEAAHEYTVAPVDVILGLKPAGSAGVGADQRGSDAERLGNGAVLAGSGAVNSGAASEQQSAEPGGVPRNGSRSPRLSPLQPPAFQLSPQQQPPHHQPSHQQSPYQQVPHQQAPHQQPSHQQSPYQQVSHQQAQYQQPPHQPPPHQQPQYQQPPHQQPQQEAVPQQESSQGPSPSLSHTSSVGPSQTASFGSQGGTPGSVQIAATLLQFSYNELFEATNGFSREGKLGEGGFGSVHKGRVHVGGGRMEEVAVKALNQEGYQGEAEWVTEVRYLGALGHPNLVRLVGYCMEGEHRLLAYELMEYGSLERYLFRRNVTPLPWNIRMKVALHAARGLAYLHEETEAQVIYRDFKASNILVDRVIYRASSSSNRLPDQIFLSFPLSRPFPLSTPLYPRSTPLLPPPLLHSPSNSPSSGV
ncbi:unnamed protein product [Closterium sp. Naga37s-1]|nr:unnamed protein product [Closterium sp. Naga37s-1]